jgi:hypothetical protein
MVDILGTSAHKLLELKDFYDLSVLVVRIPRFQQKIKLKRKKSRKQLETLKKEKI